MVYMLALFDVKDPQKLAKYSATATATLEAFGAQVVTKGKAVSLTGHNTDKAALLSFPDLETAQRWYASPEYQALIALREEGSDMRFFVIDD